MEEEEEVVQSLLQAIQLGINCTANKQVLSVRLIS